MASPSPNDPTAAFPSFSLALADGSQDVTTGLGSGSIGAKNTKDTAVAAVHTPPASNAMEGQPSIPFPVLEPPRARLSMLAVCELQQRRRQRV